MAGYEPRTYRRGHAAEGLVGFALAVGETDLHIQVPGSGVADVEGRREVALRALRASRSCVEAEIALRPAFGASLEPLPPREDAPPTVSRMYQAAVRAGVGPMAAVAGSIAQDVGDALLSGCDEVIVENGGDIRMRTLRRRLAAIYAGRSVLSNRVGVVIPPGETVGICTSSGTVGHSLSLGKADAALVIADDTAFADAVATALGNRVRCAEDVQAAIDWAAGLEGVRQAIVICGAAMGVWGQFEIEGTGRSAIGRPEGGAG